MGDQDKSDPLKPADNETVRKERKKNLRYRQEKIFTEIGKMYVIVRITSTTVCKPLFIIISRVNNSAVLCT